jgi:hypothetical protein
MTQLQWTVAVIFAVLVTLASAVWRFYAEGFTWRVAALAVMAALILAGHFRRARALNR